MTLQVSQDLVVVDAIDWAPIPAVAARFSEEWTQRGWLVAGSLRVARADWTALGACSLASSEAEEQHYWLSEWAAEHDAIVATAGLVPERVRLEMVGFFGASGARIRVTINGEQVAEGSWWERPGGLTPFTAWLCSRLLALPERDRGGQLRRWAEVRLAIDDHLPALRLAPSVEIDATLSEIRPQVAHRFRLRWEPELGAHQLYSLRTEALAADGTATQVDYGDFDDRGIVASDRRRPLLLPDDVTSVMQVARTKVRRSARELGAELSNPAVLIPEGVEADRYFDLSQYSERVLGFELVDRSQSTKLIEATGVDWFGKKPSGEAPFIEILVDSESAAGQRVIPIPTEEDARTVYTANEAALSRGSTELVKAGELSFRPSENIRAQLRGPLRIEGDAPPRPLAAPKGNYAAIVKELESAQEVDADGIVVDESIVPWGELTALLKTGTSLMPHQRRGIAWIWGHLVAGTPGVLLADDMGLGKTFQASCFLALRALREPGKRHLIVAPTVLLENWDAELEKFFRPEVLGRRSILHDDGLRRSLDSTGAIDTSKLERFQLVITNYDTLARHQKSLLKIDFDVVVFDEAQNVKNATTLKARAARALKRGFAIAMTGTPVETTMSDVWSLYDATQTTQPRVFGSIAEFDSEFTKRGADGIAALRKRLKFPSSQSSLLRREKKDALRDLPKKRIVPRFVEMTAQQAAQERAIIASASRRGALGVLEDLRKLYQHPSLLESGHIRMTTEEALVVSPKTRLCLDILEEVRQRGEKALVFSLRYQVQDLLAQLFVQRLGLKRVHIINGDPRNRKAAHQRIAEFSSSKGFDVMILSPIAAGVGLTITAANNVIHYERWWNHAKEDQATDRAHRIGQTKEVNVYYPVLHRPGARTEGFDVRLHELVERRREMARDFLAPSDELEPSGGELKQMIAREGGDS